MVQHTKSLTMVENTLMKWTKKRPLELVVFIWSIVRHYVPIEIRQLFFRYTRQLVELTSPYIHLYIDEYTSSQLYSTSSIYVRVRAYLDEHGCKSSTRFRLHAPARGKRVFRTSGDEEVIDQFKGVTVWWVLEVKDSVKTKAYKLMFHRKYRELISGEYLDYVINEGKMIIQRNRTRKLYLNKVPDSYSRALWMSVNFEHPANFDNLAMSTAKKREIVEDLLSFSKSKDFYARVGKAWKRGYLLYGPPGTGKSTMIAAMANLLGYDVYDLELTSVSSNEELRRLLISTDKKSIIAIEDVDCSLDITQKRDEIPMNTSSNTTSIGTKIKAREGKSENTTKQSGVTLSGLLNFIDGIWSASEGERIFVFTTNSLAKLDPALIRTGRMDKHIEMSYCCFEGFKVLAKNYLLIDTHDKFDVIRELLEVTKMTPADVGECLMPKVPSEDVEVCLDNLICALEKARDDQVAKAKAAELKKKKKEEEEEEEEEE
ncbi:hypothetical protein RND81_10G221400 [Saponaria officinalis]|uniref:AAA+ ATPase domain-containing protein n=1 Tax=Saponaria officinalis TaxID=3572 RepID=A0AAW1I557_SAPOF